MAEELSRAALAARLLRERLVGVLATNSKRHPGYPFASLVPYALDDDGSPFFVMSGLAVHTKNLAEDPRVSFLVTAEGADLDPLTSARLTLMGRVTVVEDDNGDNLRRRFVERFPDAAEWVAFGDFRPYRLQIEDVYYIGGFGAMGWVSPRDLHET